MSQRVSTLAGHYMTDPLIHTGITDELPEGHPEAFAYLHCTVCQAMVHAGNNECMRAWVETGKGPHCLTCFTAHYETVDEEEWALWVPRT